LYVKEYRAFLSIEENGTTGHVDECAVREMIDEIQVKFGRIDILINTAGRGFDSAE